MRIKKYKNVKSMNVYYKVGAVTPVRMPGIYDYEPFRNNKKDIVCGMPSSSIPNSGFTSGDLLWALSMMKPSNLCTGVGKKVFLTPECKLSRDIVRRDYKIVRDYTTADVIVTPEIKTHIGHCTLAYENIPSRDTLILVNVYQLNKGQSGFSDNDTKILSDAITKKIADVYGWEVTLVINSWMNNEICFLNTSDVVVEQLMKYFNEDKYISIIQDYDLKLNCTHDISVDQLMIWSKMGNTQDMLLRELADSNWKNYPLTVCMFLSDVLDTRAPSYFPSCCDTMVRSIRYSEVYSYGRVPNDFEVSGEDWKMAQDYQFRKLGLDGKYGHIFVPVGLYNLPFRGDMIRKCVTLGIYDFEGTRSWGEIKDIIKNS